MSITPIVNRPRRCREALARTRRRVILDLETTGLDRRDEIVSAGLGVDDQIHLLFARSEVVANVPIDLFRDALAPLAGRADLTVVGHNVGFDLGMLAREGIAVAGTVHDTERLLRLVDADRGKNKDVLSARIDRRAPDEARRHLDYRLKHAAPQILGIGMVQFDDRTPMAWLPFREHVLYLASDLLGTALFYDHLIGRLTPGQRAYHDRLIAPLTPILVAMTETGVRVDHAHVRVGSDQLRRIVDAISEAHLRRHGVALGMDQSGMTSWLFGELGLRPKLFKRPTEAEALRGWARGMPSLDSGHLKLLLKLYGEDRRVASSIDLIRRHRRASHLLVQLLELPRRVNRRDGRLHTQLKDSQATGRIGSTEPNLQAVAKVRKIAGAVVRNRNAIVAADGHELVAFDIKQADIRVLAHAIDSFPSTADAHLEALRRERLERIGPLIQHHLDQLRDHRNPAYRGRGRVAAPEFYPFVPCALGETFRRAKGDFYENVAASITGDAAVSKEARGIYKTTTLGMVNSIGPGGLARQLGYGDDREAKARARGHMEAFWRTYPQVARYSELMRHQVALTGMTETWAGRTRACSAHRWMVTRARVEILISFKGGDWYWLDVVPLRPGRRVLTCWIRRAWDASFRSPNFGDLIYEDTLGPLSERAYRLFQQWPPLMYRLPVRNVAWRSIRRVRTESEEATYHGFDATARSLINHVYQGGTADLSKTMMIRAMPYCRWAAARLLLQIHDELVFEVPEGRAAEFTRTMKRILELPPSPTFRVPIEVEAKRGRRFGEMAAVDRRPKG